MKPNAPAPTTVTDAETALGWAVRHGTTPRVFAEVERQLRQRRQRRALAAGLALVVLLGGGAFWWSPRSAAPTVSPALAAANAVISVPAKRELPDGTSVELKDGAQITFDYSGPLRRVTLHQGAAYFAVAKDAQRPFVVEAAGVTVRAVGTAFIVQRTVGALEVIVTEGTVAVSARPTVSTQARSQTAAPAAPVVVDSGKRCMIELTSATPAPVATQVTTLDARTIAERLAWRVPRLEFSGTPLAQAIPLFNRHAGVRLVLDDAALGTLELSGVVRADNTDSLLRLLEGEFGITAEKRGEDVLLRKGR